MVGKGGWGAITKLLVPVPPVPVPPVPVPPIPPVEEVVVLLPVELCVPPPPEPPAPVSSPPPHPAPIAGSERRTSRRLALVRKGKRISYPYTDGGPDARLFTRRRISAEPEVGEQRAHALAEARVGVLALDARPRRGAHA